MSSSATPQGGGRSNPCQPTPQRASLPTAPIGAGVPQATNAFVVAQDKVEFIVLGLNGLAVGGALGFVQSDHDYAPC